MRGLVAALLLVAAPAGAEPVALLATDPLGDDTVLYFVEPEAALPPPAARFEHLPGASVQAAILPGTRTVLAVADRTPARDRSFGSALVRLAPGAEPAWLCDRVVMASRPLVTADGRVFVSRGRAGPERDGELRVDQLTVDEIAPGTGRARTVHAMRGYLLYLAGASSREIFIYRVRPDGADVVAISPAGARMVIASLPPFARDFSVDAGGQLGFRNLVDGRWRAQQTGKAATAGWEADADRRILALSADRRRAAVLVRTRDFPLPVVQTESGALLPLPWPAGRRVTLAGFAP